ncbi:BRD4-interacting chromatin-remodeling complex-associated protein isoform X1 [Phyllopteryx taeniolatus]|uniref:BRD4-interacting chromatin-remodeling complex-associated protein isoform X1 n=2 Tax=Phyllopteryx taeniolatus TaxID=161469 RepID=UPI002AD2857C|nr:BRD4-interacting chromatin-remodeling complex-associated protein isoform X1 [Phyllopteryx taeniolatus]XP_061649824.1 BRD4-interacting chromatin-remodeling complex-associated protein isoform X1 [Phyllopteryx taeniolatus]
MDMEDEDGTCLLDVLCDPQALNDFLHGTAELQTEDLLISASSGEPSLFADAPSPVSLLGDGGSSPSTPPHGCVDLSFLEEALLSSPEDTDDAGRGEVPQAASPVELGCQSEEEVAAKEEEEVACCDILQQSLKEADITEQTVTQTGDSLYPPALPFAIKSVVPALPRDTQAAVEPPQPSLLAVGPGCPSLKPTPPPQLMGLLPGNVFPAPSPETSLVQGSGMILHKAVSARPLVAPAAGIVLQRTPLPIQPKLPISIQPRLVQISPKPLGQKLVPGTTSPNILLSQQPSTAVPAAPEPLPKPVRLQLLNQGGSFMLQPQGLFQGQNQFLLPGQSQVTIAQPAAGALLTATPQGPRGTPFGGQIVDGSQFLTVPQRQLNFSPVFATGQLALGQAAIFSPTVFQMPAQLATGYANSGQGQRATLVHGPAVGNRITLINGSGMLPSDLASISIVNAPSVVQGLPLAAQPTRAAVTDAPRGLQAASVALLPERGIPEERGGSEESFQQQRLGPVIQQQVSVRPLVPSPPVATVLPPPPEPAAAPDVAHVVKDVAQSLSQDQDFIKQLQQQAFGSPVTSDILVGVAPAVSVDSLTSTVDNEQESQPATIMSDSCPDASPLPSDSEDASLLGSSPSLRDSATFPDPNPLSGLEGSSPRPQVQYQVPHQFQGSQTLFMHSRGTLASPSQAPSSEPTLTPSITVPQHQPDPSDVGGVDTPIQQHTQITPTAALVLESDVLTPDVRSPSPNTQEWDHYGLAAPRECGHVPRNQQLAGVELQSEEPLTPATRRHRFQQLLCSDHLAVQHPRTGPAFRTLTDAARRLLPYHVCAGHTPSQEDFALVDQEFDTVSGFLLKRTKDMVNKYRQLLVRETWQESPSAEMVMLERLFLQAERFSLGEDRQRANKDPESFLMSLTSSASSSHRSGSLQPPPPAQACVPAWTRLSDRPPGLKTYRSSSRGALRLTIKQECGYRKVVRSSIADSGPKRHHVGQLSNGGGGANGVSRHPRREDKIPNGVESKKKNHLPAPPPQDTPRVKCLRLDVPPPLSSLEEDIVLSEHLQSAIDSILELQRLQGPSAGPLGRAPDQPVSSALGSHL